MKNRYLVIIVLMVLPNFSFGKKWFVNINATGSNTGSSWANAYVDLQSAISSSSSGDTIWVAAGTYKPTTGTSRSVYFTIKSGVSVFGGFTGKENYLAERDLKNNMSILSGDIGNTGDPSDNTNHVIYVTSASTRVRIDGFKIVDGRFSGGGYGAGAYFKDSKVSLSNCHFTANSAGDGGAITQESGDLTVEDCLFNDNVSTTDVGSAIQGKSSGNFTMGRCQFYSNQASNSTATVYISSLDAVSIYECIFAGNYSYGYGAAIATSSLKVFTLKNSLIVGNYGRQGKPVFLSNEATSTNNVINCTIIHNKGDSIFTKTNAQAIYFSNFQGKVKNVINCIIRENTGNGDVSPSCTVTNCFLENNYSGGTNISTKSPQFRKPGKLIDAPFTLGGVDYSLLLPSPAVDFGDQSVLNSGDTLDAMGNKRLVGTNVDAGSLENQYCNLKFTTKYSGPKMFCEGGQVVLTADTGNKWLWTTGSVSKSITVNASGTYSVKAMDTSMGCLGRYSDSITVFTSSVKINGNNKFCSGSSSVLAAVGSNSRYLWSNGDTTQSTTVSKKGTYKLRATSDKGCYSYDSVSVIIDSLPIPKLEVTETSGLKNNDTVICSGAKITLLAGGGIQYVWSDSSKNAQLSAFPANNIQLMVKVTNALGCSSWSSPVNIKVDPLPKPVIIQKDNSGNLPNDSKVCAGDTAYLESAPFDNYLWNNGLKLQSIKVKPLSNTTYTLTVTDSNKCMANTSISIVSNLVPTPGIQKLNNTLSTVNYSSYQWYRNDTLIQGASTQDYVPDRNGKYKVGVIDGNGCLGFSTTYNFTDLGLDHLDKTGVTITPNPAHSKFSLSNLPFKCEIRIYNSTGTLVLVKMTDAISDKIEVEHLEDAMYFITFLSNNGKKFSSAKLLLRK